LAGDKILPEYLYLLLHSYDICKVFYGMGGGVRQSIGFKEIRKLLVLVPPKKEQERISQYCYDRATKMEKYITGLENKIILLQEYRTRLISDVVTGKVDVRGMKMPKYDTVKQVTEEIDSLDGDAIMEDDEN
jgi:type I restriction enzyme S subunit